MFVPVQPGDADRPGRVARDAPPERLMRRLERPDRRPPPQRVVVVERHREAAVVGDRLRCDDRFDVVAGRFGRGRREADRPDVPRLGRRLVGVVRVERQVGDGRQRRSVAVPTLEFRQNGLQVHRRPHPAVRMVDEAVGHFGDAAEIPRRVAEIQFDRRDPAVRRDVQLERQVAGVAKVDRPAGDRCDIDQQVAELAIGRDAAAITPGDVRGDGSAVRRFDRDRVVGEIDDELGNVGSDGDRRGRHYRRHKVSRSEHSRLPESL